MVAATTTHAEPARDTLRHVVSDVSPNDNRVTAGVIRGDTLFVELETRMGRWHPESRSGLGLDVAAFAEVGKTLQNPGPVIRARQGMRVVVVVHNQLAKALTLRGLGSTLGLAADSVSIAPGARHTFAFYATAPGTFYYAGKTSRAQWLTRGDEDSQLNGAIVIDGSDAVVRDDRVFLISWWYKLDATSTTGVERLTIAINGQSWPHTEPLHVAQGDSLRWRWINMTILNHPMHLHGFYFRVDGVGDGSRYTTYAAQDQRQAVTELMSAGGTMEFTWSPSRPGNWLLHCHVATHMSHIASLSTTRGVASAASGHSAHSHAMAGMVMGIYVAPRGTTPEPPATHRPLRLLIDSHPNVFGAQPGYRYRFGDDSTAAGRDFTANGPTLVLTRNEPVAVRIVNRSHEPAAVHWHGIELESFPDGVPGFSGEGNTVLPAIATGDSLTVRFTPTRAGTFMYHSHFNEIGQISSGLHGAIIVLDSTERWSPETDRVLLFSDDGPTGNLISGPFPATRVNGKLSADTLHLSVGVTYRLRLINIRTDYTLNVSLMQFVFPATWTPVAKDGAHLPQRQRVAGPARVLFGPGEIHDVEFTLRHRGTYLLHHSMSEMPPALRQRGAIPVVVH